MRAGADAAVEVTRMKTVSWVWPVCLVVAVLTVHAAAQKPARPAKAPTASGLRQVAYIKASNPGEEDKFGDIIALSGDGNTLAVGAPLESSASKGINGKGANDPGLSSGAVYVYARNGTRWVEQAYVKASNPGADDQFGYGVGLSADGNTLVVSAPYEDSAATGVNGNQEDNSVENSGAVYVFSRSGSTWSQQAYLKASNTGEKDEGDQFGYSVAVSGDGNTVAVGAIGEDSAATGINGNQNDNTAGGSGATYVFTRSGNTWAQQARVQAASLDPQDSMGCWVAISDDGNTIAAGALDEDTLAPGI